ncbi:MAG: sulfatase [Verrucomicrobiaceae bacterium]|nr:sulfatase [Verrucomicrobiaceae bacterium]
MMRSFALFLVLLLAFGAEAMLSAATKKRAPKSKPNFLFILVDDLNDWVGWLGGHPQARTPNMDRLAAMGIRFSNAHTAFALCNPSRTALLTGMAPWKSGVHGNEQDWRRSVQLKGKLTMPEFFKAGGFTTAAAGKVFHANHGGPEGRLTGWHGGRRGFELESAWDVRFPQKGVQIADLPVHTGQNFNGLNIWHWDWGGIDVNEEVTDDAQTVGWAGRFLAEKHKKPFFLTVGLYRPHSPWYVPKEYLELFPEEQMLLPRVKDDDLADVPEIARGHVRPGSYHEQITSKGLWKSAVRNYLACIAFADAQVGKLLEALMKGPHADNTVVCLTSDHGWYLGEKQMWHKGRLWEDATHVPLTLVVPGFTEPQSGCTQAVSLLDLYPTFADLAGLKHPSHLDGESLVPLIEDPTAVRAKPAVTTSDGGEKASYSARTDRWRYIRYSDGSEELYDHQADPEEWNNLASLPEHTSVKSDLAAAFPQVWASASRPASECKMPASPDGSMNFTLQAGDVLEGADAPQIEGCGFDLEARLDYRAEVDRDSTIAHQGDSSDGWVLHFYAGTPTFTLIVNKQRKSLSLGELKDGSVTLRAQVSGGGVVSLAVIGHGEAIDQCPFPAGFPTQPKGELRVAQSFGPLTVKDFPNSTPYDGVIHHIWMTVLPRSK